MRDAESRFAGLTQPGSARCPVAPGSALSLLGALALVVLLVVPGLAQAATVHVLDKTLPLPQEPNMVAVDQATGSIYVSNWFGGGAGDIRKYNAAGEPESFSALGTNVLNTGCDFSCRQIAVDNSGGPNQGVIYVSTTFEGTNARIETYLPSGTQVASITKRSIASTRPFCGVAVDGSGAVYTTHSSFTTSQTYVDKFQPLEWAGNTTQEPLPTATISPLDRTNPCRTAIDSASNLVIKVGTTSGTQSASLYSFPGSSFGPPEAPFSAGTSTLFAEDTRDVAINAADDNVYVSKPTEVVRYTSGGTPIESFGFTDGMTSNQGIAVNPEDGTVYVADGAIQRLRIYREFDAAVPTINPATEVLQFTAHVSGEVDPDGAGNVTDCQFEYVDAVTYSSSRFETAAKEPCEPPVEYSVPQAVSADLSGMTAEKTYYFRLAATNANGTNYSAPLSFTTHAVQDLTTEAATGVGPREATLHASFTGVGEETDYYFQFGKTTSYDQATPVETAGGTTGPTAVATDLTGLDLETTYHYRVVATNSSGTTFGQDMDFTTPPAVAGVLTNDATDISQAGIALNGEFDGNGAATSYYFEYGPTLAYGMVSEPPPGSPAGSPLGPTQVSTVIDEFEGYTTYHFRLVAVNSFGETRGPDKTFTTLPAPLPGVSAPTASAVRPTSAVLEAQINPNRWPTVYLFEWGPSTAYGSATVLGEAIEGMDNLNHPVEAEVGALSPATVYHFRVVAINFTGTTNGPDQTFVTPDAPRIDSSFASAVWQSTARLGVRIAANARPTEVRFEYGATAAYGASTPPVSIGSDLLAVETGVDVGGLQPGTTYHFRVVASNEIGTTHGPDLTFTTQPTPAVTSRSVRKCRRGFIKRRGRCVKRKQRRHRRHRRHRHRRHG